MNLKYKKNILFALKWSGFFSAAKKLTRKGLRILCFHGISDNDEVLWRPGLYIKTEQFKQRLNYLCHNHFPVFELDNAFELLQKNKLPPNSTVITIDDGFYNTISNGDPLLYYYRFPYTVYVSSYYSQKESPLFNLSVSYMLWKTSLDDINFSFLGINLPASKIKKTDKKFSSVENTIIQFGQGLKKQSERDDIIKKLGDLLAVDTDCLFGERKLSIMNRFEIKKISSKGADIQLHTHRHIWPNDKEKAINEIQDNRFYLESLVGKKMKHFCYPSGYWRSSQIDYLKETGIKTATTCDSGFNYPGTNPYLLKRYVDNSTIEMIEFEAKINGFYELLRKYGLLPIYSLNSVHKNLG